METGEGSRFPLCLLDDDDNQVCFWPSCCEAIISSPCSLFSSSCVSVAPQSQMWNGVIVWRSYVEASELCILEF